MKTVLFNIIVAALLALSFVGCSSKHSAYARPVFPDRMKHKDYYFTFDSNKEYFLKVTLRNDLPFEKHPNIWLYTSHKPPKPLINIQMHPIRYDIVDLAYEHKMQCGSMYELEELICQNKPLVTDHMNCLETIYTSGGKYGYHKRFCATCRERVPKLKAHFNIEMMEGHRDILNLDDPVWDRYFETIVNSMELIHIAKEKPPVRVQQRESQVQNAQGNDRHRRPKTEADLRAKPTPQEIEEDDLEF